MAPGDFSLGQPMLFRWNTAHRHIPVRIAAKMDHGWSINRSGSQAWIVDIMYGPPSRVIPHVRSNGSPDQADRLEEMVSQFRSTLDEIKSNMEWGVIIENLTHVLAGQWMLEHFDMFSWRPIWRDSGTMP